MWCSCNQSDNQPFCDGSHKGTDMLPIVFENEKESNIVYVVVKTQKMHPIAMAHIQKFN